MARLQRQARRLEIEDCALNSVGTEGNYGSDLRADLVTDSEFTNFEISLEWKASKGGNSGLMYGVVEDPKYEAAWKTGPEYQFIDDVGFPQKLEEWQKAGANYAMHLAQRPEAAEAGGGVEQHPDRGERQARGALAQREEDPRVRALERRLEEAARLRQVERAPDYGLAKAGRIVLQDHGSVFWFRNVKIRPLQSGSQAAEDVPAGSPARCRPRWVRMPCGRGRRAPPPMPNSPPTRR